LSGSDREQWDAALRRKVADATASDPWALTPCRHARKDQEAAYLNSLIALGVDGFRWDSAEEMDPADIAAIEALLSKPVFVYQDVEYGAGQAGHTEAARGHGLAPGVPLRLGPLRRVHVRNARLAERLRPVLEFGGHGAERRRGLVRRRPGH
jgi:hypothetical protein